jgi:hypothetical protein
MTGPGDQRGWAAMIYPTGVPDVFGAIRGSSRLHWTQRAAREEAERWVSEMSPPRTIRWEAVGPDVLTAIGRTDGHAIVIRSILLPLGDPPVSDARETSPAR